MQGLRAGGIVVDMTTSEPSLAAEIATAAALTGVEAVDAPVSGGYPYTLQLNHVTRQCVDISTSSLASSLQARVHFYSQLLIEITTTFMFRDVHVTA